MFEILVKVQRDKLRGKRVWYPCLELGYGSHYIYLKQGSFFWGPDRRPPATRLAACDPEKCEPFVEVMNVDKELKGCDERKYYLKRQKRRRESTERGAARR